MGIDTRRDHNRRRARINQKRKRARQKLVRQQQKQEQLDGEDTDAGTIEDFSLQLKMSPIKKRLKIEADFNSTIDEHRQLNQHKEKDLPGLPDKGIEDDQGVDFVINSSESYEMLDRLSDPVSQFTAKTVEAAGGVC